MEKDGNETGKERLKNNMGHGSFQQKHVLD